MTFRTLRLSTLLFATALVAALAPPRPTHAKTEPVLQLRAFAVNMSGGRRASAGTLDITIERWSTDEERSRLLAVLVEKGPDDLVDALRDVKPRAGFVRTSRSLGWDIGYAREMPFGDGGRRIVFATDRPMSFLEVRNRPRSADYEFLVAEIRLLKDGKGEGTLAAAARIEYDKNENTIQVENYDTQPVRLTQVTIIGPKPQK
jgi:hypothetical protein